MFAASNDFLPSPIFAGKAISLPLEWSPLRAPPGQAPSLARKYKSKEEVNRSKNPLAYLWQQYGNTRAVKNCIVHVTDVSI